MKKLILVRHGKSQKDPHYQDQDRPLKKRAYKDSQIITKAFKKYDKPPFLMLTSPAFRALETARLFRGNLNIPQADFHILKELYTFNFKTLLQVIHDQNDAWDKMMIFGHNPALLDAVNTLGNKFLEKIPTTGLVVIASDTDHWNDFYEGQTVLQLFPKMFK